LTYNSNGGVDTLNNQANQTTRYVYDVAGRLIGETFADGRVISLKYDPSGDRTVVTPPGRSDHVHTFNPVGELTSYSAPAVATGAPATQYTYNSDRQLSHVALPDGQSIDVGFDTAGRVSTLTLTGAQIQQTYDAATGNLTSDNASSGSNEAFAWDGALQTGTTWTGAVAGSSSRVYDNMFRVVSDAVDGSNVIAYSYDADGLLSQLGALTLGRDPQSGATTSGMLASLAEAWGYNAFGEMTSDTLTQNGTSAYGVQLVRDKLGRITQKTETVGGVSSVFIYGYDAAGDSPA
jgi:YD repeat-containing protein